MPTTACTLGTFYPWAEVALSLASGTGSNALYTLTVKPIYQIVTAATPTMTLTFTETITFPAGWGTYLTASGFWGTVGTGANAPTGPTIAFVGPQATATQATITWSFLSDFARCYCFGPVVTFATIPVTAMTATASVITYGSAKVESTVSGVKQTCVDPVLNAMKIGLVQSGNKATISAAASTLSCVPTTAMSGISDLNTTKPDVACGG